MLYGVFSMLTNIYWGISLGAGFASLAEDSAWGSDNKTAYPIDRAIESPLLESFRGRPYSLRAEKNAHTVHFVALRSSC